VVSARRGEGKLLRREGRENGYGQKIYSLTMTPGRISHFHGVLTLADVTVDMKIISMTGVTYPANLKPYSQ
jgi:hypothetical protein